MNKRNIKASKPVILTDAEKIELAKKEYYREIKRDIGATELPPPNIHFP